MKRLRQVDIVFDGPPSHESGRFVEAEDTETGRSICLGEWVQREDGYWVLRMHAVVADVVCPICQIRPANPDNRTDARGRKWCDECQTEFDKIDWDEVRDGR